ncbi:MAG: phosphatase PAP2 family protein [Gemmatimonadaceae bacterium]
MLIILALAPNHVGAQLDSTTHISRAWLAPIAVAVAGVSDSEVREWAGRQHNPSLDRVARTVNRLGTARVLVPAMGLTFLSARLTGNTELSGGTIKTAAAYVMSDMFESVLKPIVGRERPHVEGNARRFRPFTANGDWHSLPSAHMAHITSIVEAIAEQTHSRTLELAGSTLVGIVGWDRVYEDQHWTSDVATTIVLTTMVSSATIKWLDSHWRPRDRNRAP